MTIQIDSREKARAIVGILDTFRERGVSFHTSKLYVGDYMSLDNARLVIDRKQSLGEVAGNLAQDHKRFRDECLRALDAGIKIVVLVEHGGGVKSLNDVFKWYNPRLYVTKSATPGPTLAKQMWTMAERYGIEWLFCEKADTGDEIIRLLGGDIRAD